MKRFLHQLYAPIALVACLIIGCGETEYPDATSIPTIEIPSDASDALKTELEAFSSESPLTRAKAVRDISAMGEDSSVALPCLVAMLEDPDVQVRAAAAESLGEIGVPDAVDPLVEVMEGRDEDWSVRARAARSLGKLGDAKAVDPLIASLNDMTVPVREMSVIALGEIGDPAAREALEKVARLDSDLETRYEAEEALGKLAPNPSPENREPSDTSP